MTFKTGTKRYIIVQPHVLGFMQKLLNEVLCATQRAYKVIIMVSSGHKIYQYIGDLSLLPTTLSQVLQNKSASFSNSGSSVKSIFSVSSYNISIWVVYALFGILH